MFERNGKLVGKKFFSYLVVNILMMMAVSLSSIVDGIIVAQTLGTKAMAAINACVPFTVLFGALYVVVGMGGSILAASHMGAGKTKEADGVFTLSMLLLVALGLLVTVSLTAFKEPLVAFITNGSDIQDLAGEYFGILVLGAIPLFFGPGASYFMTLDGRPDLAMILMLIYSGGNALLDLLFINVFHMGIRGAALATVLAAALGLVCVAAYFASKRRQLRFSIKSVRLGELKPLIINGLPSALNSVVLFVRMLVLNKTALSLLDTTGATIVAVCNSCSSFASIFISGITSTMLTLLSVLYGENDRKGLKVVFQNAAILVAVSSALMLLLFEGLPHLVVQAFGVKEAAMRDIGMTAVRLFGLSLPLYALVHICMSFYQATGKKGYAVSIVVCEGVVFMLPAIWLLTYLFPANGVGLWVSFICAEVLAMAYIAVYNTICAKRKRVKWLLLLPVEQDAIFDKSVNNDLNDTVTLSRDIIDFCIANGVERAVAQKTGLAVEEMVVNTIQHGLEPGAKTTIDVRASISADKQITLHIRDVGKPFNPLSLDMDSADRAGGVYLLRSMAKSIDYSYPVGFNNLIIKL